MAHSKFVGSDVNDALIANGLKPLAEVFPGMDAGVVKSVEIPAIGAGDFSCDLTFSLDFGQGEAMVPVRVSRTAAVTGEAALRLMAERKLRPPAALHPPGKEFPRIVSGEFHPERLNPPFFEEVKFGVQWGPDQAAKPFFVKSNLGGSGAIALPVVDDKILFVSQWRVNLGVSTVEVPRGFSDAWRSGESADFSTVPKPIQGLINLEASAATAVREANEELGLAISQEVVPFHLGDLWQNSGAETNRPGFWLLKLTGYQLKDLPGLTAVSFDEAVDIMDDMHTASALMLYWKHLRN